MKAEFFDDLMPLPRVIQERKGAMIRQPAEITLVTRGLNAGQEADFKRLTAIVFKNRRVEGAAQLLTVTARLIPDHAPSEIKNVSGTLREEAYELTVQTAGIVLTAGCFQGFYWGVQTIRQLLENSARFGSIPPCRIVDWPRLYRRGIHYDLAREMEYRPGHLKRVLENMAYFKMNTLHLYLENKFGYTGAADVVPPGAMTPSQAQELCAYGRALGIAVIPQIPTLGHMEHLLNGPFRYLREDPKLPENICPSHPQARPFLAGLIADVAQAFRAPYIHVGYDESRAGICKRCGQRGTPPQILADHLNWLQSEVGKHGARTMIYGDMFLAPANFCRTDAANGGTDAEARAALRNVNRDIIITDWHYKAPYGGTGCYFVANGFEVHAVSATSMRLNRGHHWIVETTDQAAKDGALGAFNSNWEFWRGCCFENYWFSQALAAERQWTDQPHNYLTYGARFSSRFWDVDTDYYSNIGSLLEAIPDQGRPWFLDINVLEPLPSHMRLDYIELAGYIRDQVHALRGRAQRNKDTLRMLDMPAAILEYLGQRALGMVQLQQALKQELRGPALAALKNIRNSAQAVSDVLQKGYEYYGSAVVDRQRIQEQLRALDGLRAILKQTAAANLPEWSPARQLYAVNQRLQDRAAPGIIRAFMTSRLLPALSDIRKARFPGKNIEFRLPEHNYPATRLYPVLETHIVDIRQVHQGQDGLVYLRATVRLNKGGPGKLFYGADGPVKVFVNGVAVGCQPQATNPLVVDSYACDVRWKRGPNDVVIAVSGNRGNTWGINARVFQP